MLYHSRSIHSFSLHSTMLLHALPNTQGEWILGKQWLWVWHTPRSQAGGKEQRAIQVTSREKGSPGGTWIVRGASQSGGGGLPGNLGLCSFLCPPAPISLPTDYILEVLCFCAPKLSLRQTLGCHGNNWHPNFICSYHSRVNITWLWLGLSEFKFYTPMEGSWGSSVSNHQSAASSSAKKEGTVPKRTVTRKGPQNCVL